MRNPLELLFYNERNLRPTEAEALEILKQIPGYNTGRQISTKEYEDRLLVFWRTAHPKDQSSDADVKLKSLTPLMTLEQKRELVFIEGGIYLMKEFKIPKT